MVCGKKICRAIRLNRLEIRILLTLSILVLILTSCSFFGADDGFKLQEEAVIQEVAINTVYPVVETFTPYPPAVSTATWTPTIVIEPSFTPTLTHTPDPYEGLTISSLRARTYGSGEVIIHESMSSSLTFNRYLISYPSDELTIYGFVNIPNGDGPFPVVIALHGYIDPSIYSTLDYTTGYADELASAGYFVLHPNLRGYRPSDDGPNLFRVGMAIDVLNLIGIVKEHGGKPGPLEKADPHRIGIWGHSMGGGISVRVLTITPEIQAAVLYGSMSGDEQENFESIYEWSQGQRGLEELAVPSEDLRRISPIFHMDQVQAAVSIHHGENDATVPLEWSEELCTSLEVLGKDVECWTYPGQPHTFVGSGMQLFNQRVIDFFDRNLKN
jgi:uncharacterized protein